MTHDDIEPKPGDPDSPTRRRLRTFRHLPNEALMHPWDQKATTALEQALKARGFGLHRVVLPPQEVGGSVQLNIVKFIIGR